MKREKNEKEKQDKKKGWKKLTCTYMSSMSLESSALTTRFLIMLE